MRRNILLLGVLVLAGVFVLYASPMSWARLLDEETDTATTATTVTTAVATTVTTAPATTATVTPAATTPDTTPEYVKLYDQAKALMAKSDYSAAKGLLEQAKALEPKDGNIAMDLFSMYMATNEPEKGRKLLVDSLLSADLEPIKDWAAREYYKIAQKNEGVVAAAKKLEDASAGQARNIGFNKAIAEGYAQLGDWTNVYKVYEGLLKEYPSDHIIFVRWQDAALLAKDYNAVIRVLEPMVNASLDPATSDILLRAYMAAGKTTEALNLSKKRLDKEPTSAGLQASYAQALADAGQVDEAAKGFQKAFDLDPKNYFFKQKAGETYLQAGNLAEAKRQFNELLKAAPDKETVVKSNAQAAISNIEAMEKQGRKR